MDDFVNRKIKNIRDICEKLEFFKSVKKEYGTPYATLEELAKVRDNYFNEKDELILKVGENFDEFTVELFKKCEDLICKYISVFKDFTGEAEIKDEDGVFEGKI